MVLNDAKDPRGTKEDLKEEYLPLSRLSKEKLE